MLRRHIQKPIEKEQSYKDRKLVGLFIALFFLTMTFLSGLQFLLSPGVTKPATAIEAKK